MACIWRMHGHWRKNGYCHFYHPKIFYLHVVYDIWFAGYYLFIYSFLDEREAVYFKCKEEPAQIPVKIPSAP